MSALLDPCDSCTRCHCGARYCENADGPVCPWCKDDPEVDVLEGCPDCGQDTVTEGPDGDECASCGWRP